MSQNPEINQTIGSKDQLIREIDEIDADFSFDQEINKFEADRPDETAKASVDKALDWRQVKTVDELVLALNSGGQNNQKIAETIKDAKQFWLANKDAIVEGVLNTADDVSRPGYVDGSNSDIRQALGNIVKGLGNPELEKTVKNLLKEEMKEYYAKDQFRLAEEAIKNAPSLASLYEVVKRFSQINDRGKIYERQQLQKQFEDILKADRQFDEILKANQSAGEIPNLVMVQDLYHQAMTSLRELPQAFDIHAQVNIRLSDKVKELTKLINSAKQVPAGKPAQETGYASRLLSRAKGWFKR